MADTLLGTLADGASYSPSRATRCFLVRLGTQGAWDDALAVSGIPAKGDSHPDNTNLKCMDVTSAPLDASRWHDLAKVVAGYQAQTYAGFGSSGGDPTSEAPSWEVSSAYYDIVAEDYWDGSAWQPNVNTAGDVFDPPQMRRKINDVMAITINYASASYPGGTALAALKGTVNSGSVTVLGRTGGAGTLLMRDVRTRKLIYTPATGSAVTYYQVQYEIEYDPDGHGRTQLSVGYREKNGSTQLAEILYQGKPITRPWKLQSTGVAYSAADQADPTKFNRIAARLFNKSASWSSLSLPATE
jgi:hypothetical protein